MKVLDSIIEGLDSLPLTTLTFIFAALGGVYCLVTGQIDYDHFLFGLGATGVGTAAVGKIRNEAGKGLAAPKLGERVQRP